MNVEPLDATFRADDAVVTVRVTDVGTSGCLLQSETGLVGGTIGSLSVVFDGVVYADDVMVTMCKAPVPGDNWFRIGTQFLWSRQPEAPSLRRLLESLRWTALSEVRFKLERPA